MNQQVQIFAQAEGLQGHANSAKVRRNKIRFLHSKFQNIKPYTPGEQLNNPEVIKLTTNENPYPTLASVIEAATKAAATLSRYSDPTAREVIEPLAASISIMVKSKYLILNKLYNKHKLQ